MRNYGWTLAALLLVSPALNAQQTILAAPAALDPVKNPLDAILVNWEKAMTGINQLTADLTRTTLDKAFRTTDVFEGTAKYLKPNMAMLYLKKKKKPEIYEKFLCTGTYVYRFNPQQKVVEVYELPKSKDGKMGDDNLLSFLFGMKAADAKARYELTLLQPPANDKWYYYILIKPKNKADQKDFSRARLVLNRTTFMPRQLWFEDPQKNEVTWDFVKLDLKTEVKRTEFAPPQKEKGWEWKTAPKESGPRVIRPNK
jgi:TIGR03009 family protein